MGTAPRSPTHATSAFCRRLMRASARLAKTLAGRATNTRNSAIAKPTPATGASREGNTSSPSTRNMAICISQATPLWKRTRLCL